MTADSRESKRALRERLLLNRADLTAHDLSVTARQLRDNLLATDELANATRVAAYVSVGREPGTGPLLDALSERGVEVILPVVLQDLDLDWAPYDGPEALAPATRGLLEPVGARLGVFAVADADVVLAPALAVDRRGVRLGQGGGCYDRVLARLTSQTYSFALLHDGELLDMPLPREAHDVPVNAAATPSEVRRVFHSGPFDRGKIS